MNHHIQAILLTALLFLSLAHFSDCTGVSVPSGTGNGGMSGAPMRKRKCRSTLSFEKRCQNGPTVTKVDLLAYTGLWHQIYASGSALRFTDLTCVTANYSVASTHPVVIDVLNCGGVTSRPRCITGTAQRRPGSNRNSQLEVRFFEDLPAGDYNIVALLGNKNYGYYAAAVHTCNNRGAGFQEGYFIIARSPYAPQFTLKRLMRRMRCNGYETKFGDFVKSESPETCTFIKGPGSFDIEPPMRRS